jgi:hypothetical protein
MLMAGLLSSLAATTALGAEYTDGVIKIGVLNDQSGTYSDLAGPGSVWAAKKAVEDYCKANKCHDNIEVVFADHQNKPDIGSSVARRWYDVDGLPELDRRRERAYRSAVFAQSHSLDLRYLGARQRHRQRDREAGRRHLVLPDRRLCLRARA